MSKQRPAALVALAVLIPASLSAQADWAAYGRDPGGSRYSPA